MITSKLHLNSNKSVYSVKTIVPNAYVKLCGMAPGDLLEWTHEKLDGECILKVKVIKGSETSKRARRGS
jgi:hypothetical protein